MSRIHPLKYAHFIEFKVVIETEFFQTEIDVHFQEGSFISSSNGRYKSVFSFGFHPNEVFIGLLCTSINMGSNVTPNTLAYWKLNGDLLDYSGNDRHATGSSNITYQTLTSGIKVAKTTSSSNDGISVPGNIANLLNGDFTVSFWMNPAGSGTMGLMFAIRRDVSPYTGVLIWYGFSDNYIRFNLDDNNYIRTSVTKSQLQGKWTHFCLTRVNGVVKCYINANQEGSMNSSVYTTNGNAGYILSRINAQNMYSGTMGSEFIVENRGWDSDEITKYVNKTKALYGL